MKQAFLNYPAGLAGGALLALRASIGIFVLSAAREVPELSFWVLGAMVGLAILIAVGWQTKMASLLSSIIAILIWTMVDSGSLVLPHLLDAIALAMIGPGAYSIDARLFGRTTMRLADD